MDAVFVVVDAVVIVVEISNRYNLFSYYQYPTNLKPMQFLHVYSVTDLKQVNIILLSNYFQTHEILLYLQISNTLNAFWSIE